MLMMRPSAQNVHPTRRFEHSVDADSSPLASLYIVREQQLGLPLLAENLDESSDEIIRARLLRPLKTLARERGLSWHGIVSDAQDSIRSGVAKELPGVPHQACQSHHA